MDKPQNVDEVFNSVSTILSSNLNPPPSSILLTPRSAQAVLTLGVNPEVLKIRVLCSIGLKFLRFLGFGFILGA